MFHTVLYTFIVLFFTIYFNSVTTKQTNKQFHSSFWVSVNFATLCILTSSYFYHYFECIWYLYYNDNPIMLVLCYFVVFIIVFRVILSIIIIHYFLLIFCKYTFSCKKNDCSPLEFNSYELFRTRKMISGSVLIFLRKT